MRRLIRSIKTRAFWKDGLWIHDPRQAQHFPTVYDLLFTCDKHALRDVEMVLDMEECAAELIGLPIPSRASGEKGT